MSSENGDNHPGELAVRVRGVGKEYAIGRQNNETLRETLVNRFRDPLGRRRSDTFWALQDIDLDVRRGEVVGLIGRNGAGKSTLLKILSRITVPTTGTIDLWGRVGSLLEVGTGFHPELTGRENIFLNGSILGMSRREIESRFDEIVDFSGVERFLDTPVKRYSSGMYVRLAFAVAAHLEPEILIVDEVLAVGDAEFQKKCLGKMQNVAGAGRAVLFVSHNLAAVKSLCTRAVLLRDGRVALDGDITKVADNYMRLAMPAAAEATAVLERPGDAEAWMTEARVVCDGEIGSRLELGGNLAVEVDFEAVAPIRPALGLVIYTSDGVRLLHASSRYQPQEEFKGARQRGTVRVELGEVPLTDGNYTISLYFGRAERDTHVRESCLSLEVLQRDRFNAGRSFQARQSLIWWPANMRLIDAPEVAMSLPMSS